MKSADIVRRLLESESFKTSDGVVEFHWVEPDVLRKEEGNPRYVPDGVNKILCLDLVQATETGKGRGHRLMAEFLQSPQAQSADAIYADPNPNIGAFEYLDVPDHVQLKKLQRFYAEHGFKGTSRMWLFPKDPQLSITEDCKVNWSRKGIGNVPKQIDIDYFGFTTEMTASEFQRLVPPGVSREATAGDLKPKAEAGEAIAPPFLITRWNDETKSWDVTGHEGRSRSRLVCGHDKIPVDVIPSGLRARDITPEMKAAPFNPQRH